MLHSCIFTPYLCFGSIVKIFPDGTKFSDKPVCLFAHRRVATVWPNNLQTTQPVEAGWINKSLPITNKPALAFTKQFKAQLKKMEWEVYKRNTMFSIFPASWYPFIILRYLVCACRSLSRTATKQQHANYQYPSVSADEILKGTPEKAQRSIQFHRLCAIINHRFARFVLWQRVAPWQGGSY